MTTEPAVDGVVERRVLADEAQEHPHRRKQPAHFAQHHVGVDKPRHVVGIRRPAAEHARPLVVQLLLDIRIARNQIHAHVTVVTLTSCIANMVPTATFTAFSGPTCTSVAWQ